jgi:hypothetical protein
MAKLDSFEKKVYEILMDCTGYSFTKEEDEDGPYYLLIDLYGDVDGDPFYDFDDLVGYIAENGEVEKSLLELV